MSRNFSRVIEGCVGSVQFQIVPRQSNLEPEKYRRGKCMHHEQGQTQCGQDTGSTPHRHQCYLFAVFLPAQSTSEQGSLKKVSTTAPLCQGRN